MLLDRREFIKLGTGAGVALALGVKPVFAQGELIRKKIPSSGQLLPPIGVGTNRYGVGASETERAPLRAALKLFAELGGQVIDTAPMYGASEFVLGELISELGNREQYFLATKTDREGREAGLAQFENSRKVLKSDYIDLMQVHNIIDANTQLPQMREWKAAGRIGYVGITTSSARQYEEFEQLMSTQQMDFIQVDYSIDNREAAERILPLAEDKGIAVLVNVPLGRGSTFSTVGDRALPDWTAEFDCQSWAQFFLKYVISHPAVTCAIPGMRKESHVVDNMGAATGRLPDAALRRRQEQFFDSLG